MAKSSASGSSGEGKKSGSARSVPPSAIQSKLSRLDRELARLMSERAHWYTQLMQAAPPTPATLPSGEAAQHAVLAEAAAGAAAEEVYARVLAHAKGPLTEANLRTIFGELLSACRALVRPIKVALLGPLYTYSHLAAMHRFGKTAEYMPVGTIAAVFEEVNRGHSDYGIVPIENSTDGRIADTLDMFTRLPVKVCGEVEIRIHHALLGRCPRTEVKEVYSRPQALSQCRNWLMKHLPGARLIEVTSTGTAAQLAREKPGAAAIASKQAGAHYGLEVLAERIEDNPTNSTRFAVIGHHSSARTGKDKMALLFQVEHRPGTLAEAMNIFKRNRLNLTWIESFPVPEMRHAYYFFVELEGHETETRVRRAIMSLEKRALRLEILGSFPITSIID